MAKIGIDAFVLQKVCSGIPCYAFFLLDALIPIRTRDTFLLFTGHLRGDFEYFKKYPNVRVIHLPWLGSRHILWSQITLSYGCWRYSVDFLWGLAHFIPLIKPRHMKTLLTLHDFVYLLAPETIRFYRTIYHKLFFPKMLRLATAIIPVSQGSADKLFKYYALRSERVINPPLKPTLIHQSDPSPFLLPYGLRVKNYVVALGTLEPRKNFQKLVRVYCSLLCQVASNQILPLVIIGGGGWKNKELLKELLHAKEAYPDHFHFTGYLSDEAISYFLSGARYYVMVSKYEGYGMPIAEARTCKTSVITLNHPEMREAAENDGIFLDPERWEEELRAYLFVSASWSPPQPISYRTNREKALELSYLIDLHSESPKGPARH